MEEIIKILKQTIADNDHSNSKSYDIGLLIKARSIELLKPQVELGSGYAMESLAKIASSVSNKTEQAYEPVDNLIKIISIYLENKNNDKE